MLVERQKVDFRGVLVILTMAVTVIQPAAQERAADPPTPLPARQVATYRKIARRTFDRIAQLRKRYPHFRSIATDVRVEDAKDKLWIAYHYTHDMFLVPNPDYVAGKKNSRMVKRFSPDDGIEMDLYFYEGAWPGQQIVSPLSIGSMHVVMLIEGDATPDFGSLRIAIAQIIEEEKVRYQNERYR
jgi:hypothetical protein